ncbi:MAG: SSI family serine proteinase inhibitor [Gaiellaceae bacterium]
MRLLGVTAILLAAVVGCGSGNGSAAAEPWARLTITVWPQGSDAGGAKRWTLRCGPLGGTHPNRARACKRLSTLVNPFRPVPKDMACTQIYGGPEEALITGTFRGRTIKARFNRTDGCQIERWSRVAVLFPVSADA